MYLQSLQLTNFRNYNSADLVFAPEGLTVIVGDNGHGKTNLLEAIAYVANLRSFRTHDPSTLIGNSADQSILRSVGFRNGRELQIDVELSKLSRSRTLINKQPLKRLRDLSEALSATVFSPEDLQLVKGGPAQRRNYLDELLGDSSLSGAALLRDVDRILRQRNTLLKQAGGRLSADVQTTLEVWDSQLSAKGEQLGDARALLLEALHPFVVECYRVVAAASATTPDVVLSLVTDWRAHNGGPGLADALVNARKADLARGLTTVGPHRDDVDLQINGMPSRTHASQGEQRTLALALRLAGHRYMAESMGAPPLLLLDDVLSELDINRVRALLESLPTGQTFLTTANLLGDDVKAAAVIEVTSGKAA